MKNCVVFLLSLFFQNVFAQFSSPQNLIPDSSFEANKFIPIDYSSIGANNSWNSPSRGTTDLFCKCDKKFKKISMVNVPENSMGIQEARSGKCYAGFFAVSHGYYREYLQTRLDYPLEANKDYILTMYLSLSDYSRLAIDKIGVCFLNKEVKYEHSNAITDLRPIYINLEENVGMEINEWHPVTLMYKAKGGENTLLIGGFGIKRLWKTGNTVPQKISSPINKSIERDAYYYMDDVSLFEYKPVIEDTIPFEYSDPNALAEIPDTERVEPVTIEKVPNDVVMTFKNVLFQTGEAILSPLSYPELNIIAFYMKADPNLFIEIYGHTDNVGDEEKNKELSAKRAMAVGKYLIAKGVNEKNVTSIGYGSSQPLVSNQTEEGRKNNRRVEFILKKQ